MSAIVRGCVLAGVLVLAVVVLLALVVGCEPDKAGDKAKRDCIAKGGTYQSTGDRSGRCLPPAGGWQ